MTEKTFEEEENNLTQYSLQNYTSVDRIHKEDPAYKVTTASGNLAGNWRFTEGEYIFNLNKLEHANFDRRIDKIMQEKSLMKA